MMVPEQQVFASDVISHPQKYSNTYVCDLMVVSVFTLCSSSTLLLLSVDGIVSFLKKQAGPASVELKDDAAFQKFIADQDASVIGELLFVNTEMR